MDKATTLKTLITMLSKTPMSKREICEAMWLEEPQVEKLLTILRDEGKIIYEGQKYKVVALPAPKRAKKNKKKPISKISYILIIRIVLELIGVCASVLSVRYTAIYLFETLPPFWAWFLSSIMIIFSVMAFQMVVLFVQRKHWFLMAVFSILWVIVATYSMGSTVIGQYNARKDNFVAGTERRHAITTAISKEQIYKEQEATLLEKIRAAQVDLERYNKLIAAYDTIEKRDADRSSYNALANAIYSANMKINTWTKELDVVRQNRLSLLEGDAEVVAEEEAPTFYEWIATLFSISSAMIEFIISVLPALFIDIMAPLGVAIGLFLRDENT